MKSYILASLLVIPNLAYADKQADDTQSIATGQQNAKELIAQEVSKLCPVQ